MEALQPSLASSGLQQHYHACVEFARAVRAAVQAVLRAARLPALLLGGEQYGGSGGGGYSSTVGEGGGEGTAEQWVRGWAYRTAAVRLEGASRLCE